MARGELEFDDKTTAVQLAFDPSDGDGAFCVTVVEGPDAGLEVTVDGSQPSVLLGKSPACTMRLSDHAVSRRHARLEVVGGRLRVTDLASSNGTRVDGLGVLDAWIDRPAELRMGGSRLTVVPLDATPSPRLPATPAFGKLLGASTEMRRLHPLCKRLAELDVPVLIEGETGTGKEVLAESLVEMGPRKGEPYVVFDCTAVPPSMVEAALFGHEKGAFTGAVGTRAGVFERAHGGTLLIDEIGDLALDLQPKLLRAVERGEIYPLGGGGPTRVDVRVIAATRRDLDREIQAGRFRDDLFHRLAVARIELPPLRRRRGDVALLVKHFCRELGYDDRTIPTAVLQQWNDAAWPGNVRELKNAVARHVMLGDLDATGIEILAGATADDDWLDQAVDPSLPFVEARKRCVEAFERRYVERVLEAHGGSVKDAARAAGVAKRYFQLVKARASRERS